MALTAGVLIVGSLWWDLDPVREAWRNARLQMNLAEKVTSPIRYGRPSSKNEPRLLDKKNPKE